MTFVKVKLALAKLATGDILEVTLSGGEPLENVPRSSTEQGHEVISIAQEGAYYKVIIQKG